VTADVKVAFVGCTHPHVFARIELLTDASGVEIVGCYDPDDRLSEGIERNHGIPKFANADELMDQPGVNSVVIEGWDTENPSYVHKAIERGQAVLLEKPGAPNLTEMDAMLAALAVRPVPFHIGYQLRYSPVIPHVQRLLADGVLGPLTLVRTHAAAPVGGAAEPWQSVPGDLGGLLYTDGCHMIDLIVHLLGAPQSVVGSILKLPAGPPVFAYGFKTDTLVTRGDDVFIPLGGLMYEDGAAAILDYGDKLVTMDITGWEAHPWVEAWTMEFYGANGSLYVGLGPASYRLYVRNATERFSSGWHSWQAIKAPGVDATYTGEMNHMLDRVRRWDIDNTQWIADAHDVISILTRIFETSAAAVSQPLHTRPI
jgi:predicted dehydrogenase